MKQKDEMDEKVKKAQTKADIMESLSRTLQTERNELKEKLKKYEAENHKDVEVASLNPVNQQEEENKEQSQTEVKVAENEVTTENVVVEEKKE